METHLVLVAYLTRGLPSVEIHLVLVAYLTRGLPLVEIHLVLVAYLTQGLPSVETHQAVAAMVGTSQLSPFWLSLVCVCDDDGVLWRTLNLWFLLFLALSGSSCDACEGNPGICGLKYQIVTLS